MEFGIVRLCTFGHLVVKVLKSNTTGRQKLSAKETQ